jgi:hypothetical protein
MPHANPQTPHGSLRQLLPASLARLEPRALLLLGLGWLLSPLCWWNDLIINLPLAWGFAKLAQWLQPGWFAPGLVLGYWLSNVLGIVLMQSGALALLPGAGEAPTNRRRELLVGLATSTAYTLAVVALVRLGVLQSPLPELAG